MKPGNIYNIESDLGALLDEKADIDVLLVKTAPHGFKFFFFDFDNESIEFQEDEREFLDLLSHEFGKKNFYSVNDAIETMNEQEDHYLCGRIPMRTEIAVVESDESGWALYFLPLKYAVGLFEGNADISDMEKYLVG